MRTHIDIRNIPVCKQKQDWSAMCCKAKTLSVKRWRNARKNFAWISILFVFASERGISYVCLIHHQHRVPSESIFSRVADDLIRYAFIQTHSRGMKFLSSFKIKTRNDAVSFRCWAVTRKTFRSLLIPESLRGVKRILRLPERRIWLIRTKAIPFRKAQNLLMCLYDGETF